MYIPLGKLDPTIYYTDGGEFIIKSTGINYVGYYHKDLYGGVWTEKNHTVNSLSLSQPPDITIDPSINTYEAPSAEYDDLLKKTRSSISTIKRPKNNSLPPSQDDYNISYYTRYIFRYKLSSGLTFEETSKNEYFSIVNSIDKDYYWFSEVLWKIRGPLFDEKQNNILMRGGIIDSNKRSIQQAEQSIPGLSSYLTDLLLYAEVEN
jgi:hypothetical protein